MVLPCTSQHYSLGAPTPLRGRIACSRRRPAAVLPVKPHYARPRSARSTTCTPTRSRDQAWPATCTPTRCCAKRGQPHVRHNPARVVASTDAPSSELLHTLTRPATHPSQPFSLCRSRRRSVCRAAPCAAATRATRGPRPSPAMRTSRASVALLELPHRHWSYREGEQGIYGGAPGTGGD